MSRVQHLKKNLKVNLLFYVAYTFVGFFSRKIFLDYLGDTFVGLIGTLQSILGFLNLAELGIGTAIGLFLYKPLYDNDREKINKIIALLGYLYRRVALIICVVGLLVSLFFGIIFEGTGLSLVLILYCFFAFLISSLLGYVFNFHQSLIQADQKEYLVTSYLHSTNILRQLIQAGVAYYFKDMYLWVTLELIFSGVYSLIIRRRIKKEYPWLELNKKTTRETLKEFRNVIIKIKQVFVHKVAGFITYGTDQLLIYTFVNIQSVAFFGNYDLIFKMIQNIVGKSFSGIHAGIGNLIAENDALKIDKVFWEMMTLRVLIAGITTLNLYYLIDPFIMIWLGDKYILGSQIILLLSINHFIIIARLPIDSFLNAYGLYQDTWAPVVEIVLNLILSIILGQIWGIEGIILATTISVSSILILWKPYYLFKFGFKKNPLLLFWPNLFKLLFTFALPAGLLHFLVKWALAVQPQNYPEWIFYAIKLNVLIFLLILPFTYFFTKGSKDLIKRIRFKK